MAQATDAVWLPVLPDMKGFGPGIIKGAGKQSDKAGRTVGQRIGRGINMGVAVVAGGAALVGGALYGVGKTFDEMADTIAVSSGKTGKELDALVESAKTVGTQVPADFNTIGDALATLNTLTGATGGALEDMTGSVVEASRLLGEDASANAERFGKVMTQWQVPAEEGADKLDTLFVATQNYGVSLQGIMGHLNSYGPILQNAGFEMEEAIGFFSQLEAGGISVSRVMPALNASFRNWAAEGKNSKEELQNVVEEIKNTEDAQEALALASDVFGAQGAQRLTTAIRNGTLELEDLTGALEDSEGAIGSASEETMSFGEHWELFKNNILVEIEPLARKLFDTISDGMSYVTNTLLPEFLAGWRGEDGPGGLFQSLGENARKAFDFIKDNKEVLLGIAGALVAAKIAMVAYNVATKAMTVAKGLASGAMKVFNAVVNANPLMRIVTLITLVVGALIYFFTQTETGRKIIETVWGAIKKAFESAWNFIDTYVLQPFLTAWDGLVSVFSGGGDRLAEVWDGVKNAFSAGWNWIKDNVFGAFSTAWEGVKNFFTDDSNAIGRAFTGLRDTLNRIWKWIDKNIFEVYRKAWEFVKSVFTGDSEAMGKAFEGLRDALLNAWNRIKQLVTTPFKNVWDSVKSFFSDRVTDMRKAWDGLKAPFKAAWDFIDDKVFKPFRSGLSRLEDWVDDTVGNIGKLWDKVANAFARPINWVIRNVWNDGISGVFNRVASAIGISTRLPTVSEIKMRAKGGPVRPGEPYIVGEEGPELITPTRSGWVHTHEQTKRMLDPGPAQENVTPGPIGGSWLSSAARSVRDALSGVVEWARGGLASLAETILNPLRSRLSNTMNRYGILGDLVGGMGKKAMDQLLDWIRGKDDEAPEVGGDGWARPSRGPITSRYGPRWGAFHAGIDVAGGGPTYAAAAGEVLRTGWNILAGRTGIGIILQHAKDLFTYYGHNPPGGVAVRPGDRVTAGQRIGRQGATGNVTGVHLHFELHKGGLGRHVNPEQLGVFDRGGWLMPGMLGLNLSNRPEPVLTGNQWDSLRALAGNAGYSSLRGLEITGEMEMVGDGIVRIVRGEITREVHAGVRDARAE